MLPVEGHHLRGISPRAFQHPADRAATAALRSIPYLDTVVRKLIELGYERALRQSYLGSAVRLSEEQLGERVARARDRVHHARHGRGARPLPDAVPLAERDGDRREAPDRGGAVRARGAAGRGAAPRGVRPRGRAHPRRPPALPHRALHPDAAGAHVAAAAAAGADPHGADGVGARHGAERRPRRGARDARPADGLPHADVPLRGRDGGASSTSMCSCARASTTPRRAGASSA